MTMRSWRRGTKEMDLVLGPYAEAHLAVMDSERLDLYDQLLEENDQDLLPWVLGQVPAPAAMSGLISRKSGFLPAQGLPRNRAGVIPLIKLKCDTL